MMRKVLAYLLSFLTALPPAALAQVAPSGGTNTVVVPNGSGNGVPVVNIAAPNAGGLSHNKFNSYNVPTQGLILNNSNATATQTQLGGFILGNPNLAGKAPANLILNEVVQPNRSLLQGYQEVAGQAAQVIVANPYGITCSGCGFINTPRATLTTGTPTLDAAGNLTGFQVRMGDILINGGGLDASGQNYFDLVARSVVLQGQVNAKDLLVAAGSNDFGYLARSVTAAAPSGAAPAYAIDSSLLGGMYVDRIRLIANEAGVGVRLLGNVGASVDDITLTAAGRIELANQMSAQRDVALSYTGAAQAGAVDVSGGQVYAGRDLTLAASAGGIALGAATLGAAGNFSMTGASLADTGGAANYRFADGAVSVNVAGAANLGGNYDASGALGINAASANLGSAVLTGRSLASGVAITTTGALEVATATVSSPGNVSLSAGGAITVGATGYVESGANVNANYVGSFTNSGQIFANNNLSIASGTAGGTLSNLKDLSAGGTLTLGGAGLGALNTGAGSQAFAGSVVLNGATIANAGFVQGASAAVANNANLTNAAGGTLILGTGAGTTSLTLNHLVNQGMLYSGKNLTISAIQVDNNAGGSLVSDQTLTLNVNRAVGATGLSNTFTNTGALDVGNAVINASTVTFRNGATLGNAYASGNLAVNAGGVLTLGGSLYAGGNLALAASSLSDTVAAGTRGAANNFNVTTTGTITLNAGQVYDAGNTLSFNTPSLNVATGNAGSGAQQTTLTSGANILVTADSLALGGVAAAGSLQSGGNVTIVPRSVDSVVAMSGNSSIMAGGSLTATVSDFTASGTVLANADITLRPSGSGNLNLTVPTGGYMQGGGTLHVRAADSAVRAPIDILVQSGGSLVGDTLNIYARDLTVNGAAGTPGLLQGGYGGGLIDVTTLNLPGPNSKVIANLYSGATPTTTVNIGSPLVNSGLLYAQENLTVNVAGNITNNAGAAISTGVGTLALRSDLSNAAMPYQITNSGLIYGANGLDLRVPQAGTIYNKPGADIGSGGGVSFLGTNTAGGFVLAGTFRNEGNIELVGDSVIQAHNFFNVAPLGAVTRSPAQINLQKTYDPNGDSGRYDDFFPTSYPGYDRAHPPIVAAGAGDHVGRPGYRGFGNFYHIIDSANNLYRDFRYTWSEQESYANPGALQPSIAASGNLEIKTHTGQNIGGFISATNVLRLTGLNGIGTGGSFVNQSVEIKQYEMQSFGRSRYDCGNNGGGADAACLYIYDPVYLGDEFRTWTNPLPPAPHWGVNDGVAQQVNSSVIGVRSAHLRAALLLPSGFDSFSNIADPTPPGVATPPTTPGQTAASQSAAPGRLTPGQATVTSPNTVSINGVNVTLPTGQNGLFVPSTNPNSRFLIESNPLYTSADNPFLGSDYLAKKLGLDPDQQLLRLGDANYEARLIREQILAQTGAAILRTAYDAQEQQQMLMDNASLEAKDMKLNYGVGLTAAQVASLKHDIVWMVEQVVQGKKVLVPVVYLSSATRAGMEGASIVADTAVITGDSFLNRGGRVEGTTALVIVTRKDIVNSSGLITGGDVQLQSLEGDIINRTETFKSGDHNNFTTSAGRSGGIAASNSLFMRAERDINVQGATVTSGGDATVVAGRNLNVTALVLDARSTNIRNTSGVFNRDTSTTVETTQTAQAAAITGTGNVTLAAKNDVNVTGAYVGSATGSTNLISDKGNVNIGAIALTNTKTESTQHTGFFAEGQAGKKPETGPAVNPTNTSGQTVQNQAGTAGRAGTTDSRLQKDPTKPQVDPSTTTATGFTGLAIESSSSNSTATGNMGSMVEGNSVNIVARSGDVNITGSTVTSGAGGTYVDAARNVNILAAQDTASSSSKSDSVRIGVGGEASADGAFAGFRVQGKSNESVGNSSTASTSSLNSGGSITIIAGNRLTNEGTQLNATQNINIKAAEVENKAARNTSTTTTRSSEFDVSLMGGVTTGGMGQSIANLAQGTGQELNIGAPEGQLRLQAKGSSSTSTTTSNTAVVTNLQAGGNINYQVSGALRDEGTGMSAGQNINIDAGSYANRAAASTTSTTGTSTGGGGTLTVGVDATRSANARLNVSGSNTSTNETSSTAVVGGIKAGGAINLVSRGDVTLEGTKVDAGSNVNISAAGNLNLLQANNTTSKDNKSQEGSANASASLCVDLSCASGGAGASARTTTLQETTSTGVAGSIRSGGGSVNLSAGNNMTLQGTNISAKQDTTLSAGGNVDFQALTSTLNRSTTADGGGADVNANVGASGKIASDGGGGVSATFERGRETTTGVDRTGGSVTTGGTFTLNAGGNARLEGTGVSAGSADIGVRGNFTMESAQSTLVQDKSNAQGSLQVSGGKSQDGGRSFGGAVSVDVGTQTRDNLTNQSAGITTTGGTRLNVGGDATLAGANISAGGGVSGTIQGNLTVETRADREKTEDSSFRGFAGVGNIETGGKGGGTMTRGERIDDTQRQIGNAANTAGGTGLFIDSQSQTKDNTSIGQRSGISGGAVGLGGLSVGGNATLIGAQDTQGINVRGTTTSSAGPEIRSQETNSSFEFRGTIASMAGSDQGAGGTFSSPFQASGGQKPRTGAADTPTPAGRPRSGAVSGEGARPVLGANTPDTTVTRPRSGAVSGEGARPTLGGAATPTVTRPRSGAVSGEGARPVLGGADAPRDAMPRLELTPSAPLEVMVNAPPPLRVREADSLGAPRPAPVVVAPGGLGAPARPRTDSDALPPRPAPSEGFGAFTPLPGSTPPQPIDAAPGSTPPGRVRSDSVANTPSTDSGGPTPFGAFTPLPGSTPPQPIAVAPGSTPPGRVRSDSVADTPSTNSDGPTQFGAFTALPGSTPQPQGLGGLQRPRTDSDALPPRPASSEGFGAFTPLPNSTPPAPIKAAPKADYTTVNRQAVKPAATLVTPAADAGPGLGGLGLSGTGAIGAVRDLGAGIANALPGSLPKPAAKPAAISAPIVLAAISPTVKPAATPAATPAAIGTSQPIVLAAIKPAAGGLPLQAPPRGVNPPELAKFEPAGSANDGRQLLKNPNSDLLVTTAAPKYLGENNGGVKYLSGTERAANELVVDGSGRLVNKVTGERFSTGNKEDGAIFVIDGEGRMYASTQNEAGKFHHTSFTGGEPVASAGHVVVKDGLLLHINNLSGHYQPAPTLLAQGFNLLMSKGLDATQTRILEVGGAEGLASIDPNTGTRSSVDTTGVTTFSGLIRPDAQRAADGAPLQGPPLGVNPPHLAEFEPVREANDGRQVLKNPDNDLVVTTAAPKYLGESNGGVKYLSGAERAANELVVKDGRLVNAVTGERFSTGNKEDGAIFVIDAKGRIYASTQNEAGKFHHTSLTGGEPVAMAGHLVVHDGKLLHMNNFSGHYQPDDTQLVQGLKLMRKDGLDLSETRVLEYRPGEGMVDHNRGLILPMGPGTGISNFTDAIRPDAERAAELAAR